MLCYCPFKSTSPFREKTRTVWEERYPQEPFNLPPDPTEQEQPFFIKKTENNFIHSHNLFTKIQLLKTYDLRDPSFTFFKILQYLQYSAITIHFKISPNYNISFFISEYLHFLHISHICSPHNVISRYTKQGRIDRNKEDRKN